jgi:hypothetical protein
MRLLLAALLLAGACAPDTSKVINIAPSAHPKLAQAREAAAALNALIGDEGQPFEVVKIKSHELVDDEVVVRMDRGVRVVEDGSGTVGGVTKSGRLGIAIYLSESAGVRKIAHELCHAAGLEHHPDPGNLMHERSNNGDAWTLTEEQVDQLR